MLKKCWNFILFYKYYSILALAFVITVGGGAILDLWVNLFSNSAEKISYFGFTVTTTSVLVAIIQIARNHDWNRRHLATTTLLEIKEKVTPHILIIHENFGYITRNETDSIKVREIHDKICVKDGNGYEHDPDTRLLMLRKDEGAKTLHRSIWEALNLYEYVAAGVNQGVYDRKIVAELMTSNIIKIASVFSEYINHVNNEMQAPTNRKTWVNIKTLGEEFKKEFRDNANAEKRPSA